MKTTTSNKQEEQLSYVVARGDGSTGGGGLPMKKMCYLIAILRMSHWSDLRSEVGAKMPLGRPNWFHVPVPGGKESRYAAVKESLSGLCGGTLSKCR